VHLDSEPLFSVHLEPRYAWNMPGIYQVYVDVLGIYMVYTMYIPGHQTGYTWYILGYTMYIQLYRPSIYMVYAWKYMVYHLMYMHGIYVVYRGISIDIPNFLKPDFAAGACCWSHSMRTRVWVIKSVLFHAQPWQKRQGKRQPTKGSTLLPPTFPACRWRRR
jgi:hypothetical protein